MPDIIDKKIFTIGHSTATIGQLLDRLAIQKISVLADIRSVPRSRHNPQFNSEALAASLQGRGIGYVRIASLGGFRHPRKDSENTYWRNDSFRGYADYMATADFENGLSQLEILASADAAVIMCAESLPWRCHRSLVADALVSRGWEVFHIIGKKIQKHALNVSLRIKNGTLVYPAES